MQVVRHDVEDALPPGRRGTAGLLEGNSGQVLTQIYGVLITLVYTAVVSFILLKLIDMVMGLRVTAEEEREGLDLALHGETVH